MKVNSTEFKQLVKEEVARYRKITMLEAKKKEILQQLAEMEDVYTEKDELDEILGLGKTKFGQKLGFKSPEQKTAEATQLIKSHPAYSKTAGKVAAQYKLDVNAVFAKLVQFIVDNDGKIPTGGVSWDNAKQVFVDNTKYTGTAPGMQGGA